jgi:hypothetical protein
MSNELRTRGKMPGAIRSEIIMRSSAWEAITTSRSMRLPRLSPYKPALCKSGSTVADAAGFARRVRYGPRIET